jgi:hypothetical protein
VTERLRERLQLTDAEDFIRERFEEEPAASWSDVVEAEHDARASDAREEIEAQVREAVVTVTEASEAAEDGG